MKVKVNSELFSAWTNIGRQIQLQRAIVQNDMDVEPGLFLAWLEQIDSVVEGLRALQAKTVNYVLYDDTGRCQLCNAETMFGLQGHSVDCAYRAYLKGQR